MNKYNKYRNKVTYINGIKFDSKKEASRYTVLMSLEKAGKISDLRLQVPFDLIDTMKHNGKTLRKIVYKADFTYTMNEVEIVEDSKGFSTDVFKIKMRLFLLKYPQYEFRLT